MNQKERELSETALDVRQVEVYMGLAVGSLNTYLSAGRHPDFPAPWIQRGSHIRLWLPWQIDAFLEAHPRSGRKRQDG